MLESELRPEIARRPKKMTGRPSPPNEAEHIYLSIEQPLEGEIVSKYTKQAPFTPNLSPRDWKKYIEDTIDTDSDQLLQFLEDFSDASDSTQKLVGHEGWDGYAETASLATVISSFLASRQTKSVALGSPTFPSVVSVFDGGEGPCLVLNGLLSPRLTSPSHPYSSKTSETTASLSNRELQVDAGGTAAIVAAYAYLHSIQQHLIGTVVLSTISDTSDGHLGTLRHLLNTDERKMLWRGDCMITAATKSQTRKSPLPCPKAFSSRPATKTIDPATFDLSSSRWQRNLPNEDFTPSRVVTRCATHPVATSLSNNGKRVLGRRPSMDFQTGRQLGSHSRFWTDVGISSFCLGVGEPESSATLFKAGEEVNRKQWIQLVKVLVLTVWDQLGLED